MTVDSKLTRTEAPQSVAILGAGIIGLCCAWELADRGAKVSLLDPRSPGHGASWAAAGMLAPAFEAAHESGAHPQLAELCQAGAAVWGEFAERLQASASQSIGYASGPSLAVARSDVQGRHLIALSDVLAKMRVPFEDLGVDRGLAFEPALSPELTHVLRLPTDGHVDNRRVIKALLTVCERHANINTQFQRRPSSLEQLLSEHDQVLITAGWESKSLIGLDVPLEPVSGQLLSVGAKPGMPTRTIRAGHIYIAPKADRIVIGATVEPGKARDAVDAETVQALLSDAAKLSPALKDARVLETWFGVRPGLPDFAPVIDQTDNPYVFVSSGHHRNGILLAPITAQLVAEMMLTGDVPSLARPFRLARFKGAVV
ncbi:MAG: glycine oxidase ThiO [Pseudomonadota bacterium]